MTISEEPKGKSKYPPPNWKAKCEQLSRDNGKLRKLISRREAEIYDLRAKIRQYEQSEL